MRSPNVLLALAALLGLVATALGGCVDKPSPGYDCAWQKKWNKCYEPWMVKGNYCAKTCGRCKEDVWQPKKDEVWQPEKKKCYVQGSYFDHSKYVNCPTCAYNYCQCCDGVWKNCRDYLTGKEDPWC